MGRFFLVNFGKTADYRPAYGIGQGKCTTGRTVRMVGMAAKRGRWKGVNGRYWDSRKKGGGVL